MPPRRRKAVSRDQSRSRYKGPHKYSAIALASLPTPPRLRSMLLQTIVAFGIAVLALANPVARQIEPCTTTFTGILAANHQGVWKSFTLNTQNQVAYIGDAQNPLHVEFQHCPILEVGLPHETTQSGRVFVPSKNKCIAITNQANSVGPYYTTLADCSTEYPQRWVVDLSNNDALKWSGNSDEEGTILQGGCGLLGYKSHNGGEPVNTHSNKQITIECNGTPFRFAQTAA